MGIGDHLGHTILLECPSSITTLQSLMVTKEANAPSDNNKKRDTSITAIYPNLTDFFHCQTKEHPLSKTLQQLPSNLTFVAHTMLAFAPARRMLPSWVEYHRVIMGIQHFIIYVKQRTVEQCHAQPRLLLSSTLHHVRSISRIIGAQSIQVSTGCPN